MQHRSNREQTSGPWGGIGLSSATFLGFLLLKVRKAGGGEGLPIWGQKQGDWIVAVAFLGSGHVESQSLGNPECVFGR